VRAIPRVHRAPLFHPNGPSVAHHPPTVLAVIRVPHAPYVTIMTNSYRRALRELTATLLVLQEEEGDVPPANILARLTIIFTNTARQLSPTAVPSKAHTSTATALQAYHSAFQLLVNSLERYHGSLELYTPLPVAELEGFTTLLDTTKQDIYTAYPSCQRARPSINTETTHVSEDDMIAPSSMTEHRVTENPSPYATSHTVQSKHNGRYMLPSRCEECWMKAPRLLVGAHSSARSNEQWCYPDCGHVGKHGILDWNQS